MHFQLHSALEPRFRSHFRPFHSNPLKIGILEVQNEKYWTRKKLHHKSIKLRFFAKSLKYKNTLSKISNFSDIFCNVNIKNCLKKLTNCPVWKLLLWIVTLKNCTFAKNFASFRFLYLTGCFISIIFLMYHSVFSIFLVLVNAAVKWLLQVVLS